MRKLMKFCWKFKKIIEEQILKKPYKIWKNSQIVDNLLKNRENLLKNRENWVKKWEKQCKLLISENYR